MTRCGLIAIIGEPNAGKSTLLNQIVGCKVSIVTHKVQTTRTIIRGIAVSGSNQLVFVDTPGLFSPKHKLDRAMVAAAWKVTRDTDVILFVIEAHLGVTAGVESIIENLHKISKKQKIILVVNKIDRTKKRDLLCVIKDANAKLDFSKTFLVSATKNLGIEDLINWLCLNLPEGPWLFGEDAITDKSMKFVASEITREKLTLRLHQELPYQLTVETEKWEVLSDESLKIEQVIYVSRESHKGMVVGKNGATIKAVSVAARHEIMQLLNVKVHLLCRVKFRKNWFNEPERIAAIGLEHKVK